MVNLLMRKKKDSALGVKFEANNGDQITNIEGAMHTFVTPVLPRCEVYGDYRFLRGHGVDKFGAQPGSDGVGSFYTTRTVVLSASIHMDFENFEVMKRVCKLGLDAVIGRDLLADETWEILDPKGKQDKKLRWEYDAVLRQHMIYHLTGGHMLPSADEAKSKYKVKTAEQVVEMFEDAHLWSNKTPSEVWAGTFLRLYNDTLLSMEVLFNTALQQARNEFAALEVLCPQGYVYTYDPASIFARMIGPQILNRLMAGAVRELLRLHHRIPNMRVFAFNDYADKGIIELLGGQFGDTAKVVSKQDLFRGPGGPAGLYDVSHIKEAEGAMLVIHNNSDGFGQNIETEGARGSLDGAIGASSSAAAGLDRSRKDLLDYVW